MKFYNYFPSEKTYIEITFDYSESCHNVYKHFEVFKNGSKSNIKGLEKFLESTPPDILTAKTYFWSPSCNASGRRYNENRHNGSAESFFITEKFSYDPVFYLENSSLLKGESFGIDSEHGFFLEYRNEKYHFGYVKKITDTQFSEARSAIQKRRETRVMDEKRKKIFNSMLTRVFVSYNDSVSAGNCPVGTRNFIENLPLVKKGFHIRAIKASALLTLRNDPYTQRAVRYAIEHAEK